MALDQISSITESAFIPLLVDNIFNSNPLLVFLYRKSPRLDGGATIRQPVILTQNSNPTSYSGADMLPDNYDEENNALEFNWAQYGCIVKITGLDDLRNSGARAIINLIKAKVEIAEASLRNSMGVDLYGDGTGNKGKNLVGLAAYVDDGTNVVTYGGISRTTFPAMKGNLSANSGVARPLTISLLTTTTELSCKDNNRPNLNLTTHSLYAKYMSLMQPGIRYETTNYADTGFPAQSFQGAPVIVDEQIPTTPNHFWWQLNTNWMDLYTHRDRGFLFVPFQQLATQDVASSKILWAGQLVGSSPRLNCQYQDLSAT